MPGNDDETVSEQLDRRRASLPTSAPPEGGRASGLWRARAAETFSVGALVDSNYAILDRVGEGTMGVVLRAHDLRLDRDVAIKVIRPAAVERPDARERFLGEARAMARVRHRNVVEIHALGEWHGLPYIVMEYVVGTTLEQWLALRVDRPPTLDEALMVLDQLLLGVEAIHASGAAHRDLKAGNVLVGAGVRVVIADFGIARAFRESLGFAPFGSGTPTTMAPEVVLGTVSGPNGLERVDVYALGVLAYRLLVGRYPFVGNDAEEVLGKHVSEPPPRPCALRPDLPVAFERVLLEALEKVPEQRTRAAATLRTALHAARATTIRHGPPLQFIVADDDPAFLGLIANILLRAFPGARVLRAPDGQAALEAAEREPPSALITDLDMPRLTGLELTAAVRASERLRGVPVIIVTGEGTAADWRVLSRVGADAFLVKPFDAAHVLAVVRAILDRPVVARDG